MRSPGAARRVEPPARDAGVRAPARIFHGWLIVLTAFVCHAVNVGLMFYAWSVFLTPLAAEFGSRARIAGAYSLTQFASAAYGLWIGRIVDRQGARRVSLETGAGPAGYARCMHGAHFSPYRAVSPCAAPFTNALLSGMK